MPGVLDTLVAPHIETMALTCVAAGLPGDECGRFRGQIPPRRGGRGVLDA
ncbi:hypothetical protein ACQPXB_27945 [Amycolatopsis sp. CA-161197]